MSSSVESREEGSRSGVEASESGVERLPPVV